MNQCLRCRKVCEQDVFCENCQSALLRRSLQREETHEEIYQTSLATPVSSGELNSHNSVQHPVAQASLFVPVQDVVSSREQDSFCNTPDKASLCVRPKFIPPLSQMLSPQHNRLSHLRYYFTILVIIAIVALISDSILIFMVISRNYLHHNANSSAPIITLASTTVSPGQIALLHLSHFPARSRVLLRRDIEDQVHLDTGSPLVRLGTTGETDVHMRIEDNWGVGNHFIEAEDIDTHSIASTVIQVMGSSSAQLPHLQVSQNELDLGAGLQGAHTLQALTLQNAGAGMISWMAWSNQPWLMLTPMTGIFSISQQVMIAVNRSHLKPGLHEGTITFAGNQGLSVSVHVKMSVLPLQTDLGAALVVSPSILSLVATDGGPDPVAQLLTVSNLGSRPLSWSLSDKTSMVSTDGQVPFMDTMNWLDIKPTSGVVAPGLTTSIRLTIASQKLLPGVYNSILTFTGGQNVLNSPQSVAVSLEVQPRCGIMTNMGNMSFSMVSNHKISNGQLLRSSLIPGCGSSVAWQASAMARWFAMTPSRGQVKEQRDSLTTVTTDSRGLPPGTYTSFLVISTDHRTQTVAVQLTVQASSDKSTKSASSSSANPNNSNGLKATPVNRKPALGISSTSMTFSVTQGEDNPPDQAVTVANTGSGLLSWQARVGTTASSWLSVAPATGSIASQQNGHIFLSVNIGALSPGSYRSNVVVSATDSSGTQVPGSPQVVTVVLKVKQACQLEVSPTNLSFSASLLAPDPAAQDIRLQTVGNCVYPVTWTAAVDPDSRSWLIPSAISGQENGNGSVMTVHINTSGMLLGFYNGKISFSAVDSGGASVGSSAPTVEVALTVVG